MRKGDATRERLLDIAEKAVLAKGFGATSIDEIIAEAAITKSGFFYHFRDKNELARALIERYIEDNDALLDTIFGRAAELNEDPLQAMLIGLKMLAETMADLPSGHPGCLSSTFCYQERLFDQQVREINLRAIASWNDRFRRMIAAIAAVYPPREPVDLDALAVMCCTIIDGGIIMSRALRRPAVLPEQIMQYRTYLRLLFQPAPAQPARPRPDMVAAG